jgi:hypothetical protein
MKRALALILAAGAALARTASAHAAALAVVPTHVRFGEQPLESNTLGSFTITNQSSRALLVSIDQVEVGDDFSPGQTASTCALGETLLPAGQSCTHVVGFRPSLFFAGHETALLRVTARDEGGRLRFERDVKLSGTGVVELAVVPTHVPFGKRRFESSTLGGFTITNQGSQPLAVTIEQVEVGDDFSPGQPGSTCGLGETILPARESCTHVVGFRPSPFFAGCETAWLRVTVRDEWERVLFERLVKLSGTGVPR